MKSEERNPLSNLQFKGIIKEKYKFYVNKLDNLGEMACKGERTQSAETDSRGNRDSEQLRNSGVMLEAGQHERFSWSLPLKLQVEQL